MQSNEWNAFRIITGTINFIYGVKNSRKNVISKVSEKTYKMNLLNGIEIEKELIVFRLLITNAKL